MKKFKVLATDGMDKVAAQELAKNPHFANKSRQKTSGFYYSAKGVVRSDEYKQKMSESMKNREYKKEWVEKAKQNRRSFEGKNNPFYQKTHTPETRKKIAENLSQTYKEQGNHPWIGRKHSEESKKKMREAHTGEKNHFYGKSPNEETRKKQSEARKLWWERKRQQQNEEA